MSNDTQVKQESKWRTVICPTCGHDTTTNAPEILESAIASALATVRKEEREAAEKIGRQALAAELLGHLDRITSTTAAYHFVRNTCKIELGQEPDSLGAEIDH